MAMNKRGFFFTLLAILLLALFVVVFSPEPQPRGEGVEYIETTAAKVDKATQFAVEFRDVFLERAVLSATYDSLNNITNDMKSAGLFADQLNPPKDFQELFKENADATLDAWSDSMQLLGEEQLGFSDFDVDVVIVGIDQSSPFSVNVTYRYSATLQLDDVQYEYTDEERSAGIPIVFMRDPLHAVHDETRHIRFVDPVPVFEDPKCDALGCSGTYEIEDIWALFKKPKFRHYSEAPSFLDRFESGSSDGASDCCGIESFVNQSVADDNGNPEDKSYVDYLFFSGQTFDCLPSTQEVFGVECITQGSTISICPSIPTGIPVDNFRLEADHLNLYGFNKEPPATNLKDVVAAQCP